MTRRRATDGAGRYGAVYTLRILLGSAFAAARTPMPAPRHARQPITTDTPRSAR